MNTENNVDAEITQGSDIDRFLRHHDTSIFPERADGGGSMSVSNRRYISGTAPAAEANGAAQMRDSSEWREIREERIRALGGEIGEG